MSRPHNDLIRATIQLLSFRSCLAWKAKTVGVWDPARRRYRKDRDLLPGVADVCGCLPGGRLIGVECKTPGDELRPDQAAWIDAVNSRGGLAFVARSQDDVIRALKAEGLW